MCPRNKKKEKNEGKCVLRRDEVNWILYSASNEMCQWQNVVFLETIFFSSSSLPFSLLFFTRSPQLSKDLYFIPGKTRANNTNSCPVTWDAFLYTYAAPLLFAIPIPPEREINVLCFWQEDFHVYYATGNSIIKEKCLLHFAPRTLFNESMKAAKTDGTWDSGCSDTCLFNLN